MKSFTLTREAKEALRLMARFTEKRWGREQRFMYIKQFDDVFYLLGKNPSLGKHCDYIKKGYLKFPQSSHIIFYREDQKNKIIILRILHKNMDIVSKFLHT